MTLKLESTTTELRIGRNLAWYHHLTHITCVEKLRGLRQKLDALHVQTEPSLSKYKGFRRQLICLNLARYHHLTHITCVEKLRGLRQKLDALHVQTEPSLSKYKFLDENPSVTKTFHFSKLISTQDFFCIQYAPLKATYSRLKLESRHHFTHIACSKIIYFELVNTSICTFT